MANLAANSKVLVTFVGEIDQQVIMSMFCYHISTVTGSIPITGFADSLNTLLSAGGGLQSKYLLACPQNYNMAYTRIQVIYPVRYAASTYLKGLPGQIAHDATMPNVSAVILRRGELANRSNVSTLHVPAPNDATSIDNGLITNTYSVILQDLADELLVGISTNAGAVTGIPVIFNKTAPQNQTRIVEARPEPTARVMTRRTVGRGI